MRLLDKTQFDTYNWLNFESLPESNGYKFELYPDSDLDTAELVLLFYSLFGQFLNDFRVGQFGGDTSWGDFCIDTWDLHGDRYDYSPNGKSESTSAYLNMLIGNEIEPEYTGTCKVLNWDQFLPIVLDCILSHTAPYSVMIYNPNYDFVFYFHHTSSLGFYYKDLNEGVQHIIERAKMEDIEIRNSNDERIISA